MQNRWVVLAVLFAVRLTIAFQFQSVAAVAPLLWGTFGVDLAAIGFLIGLYFTPGIALSLPGGAIGQRYGDKATALGALILMLAGTLVMAFGDTWTWQIGGRFVAGAGGALLNVQLTKMVTDWFAGKEIATAMGIFINSWPAGIALSLLSLPLVGTAYGLRAIEVFVAALIAVGLVLAATYRPPPGEAALTTSSASLDHRAIVAVTVAGLMWGLFNVGFAVIFSFGPTMLVERGWSIPQAGSVISVVLWLALFSVPAGGFIADRVRRPQLVMIVGVLLFAALLLALAHTAIVALSLIGLGLISGHPAGAIMSLPAQVLKPATRALGMGIFYMLYYLTMMLGPMIAGAAAKWTGSASTALDVGTVVLLACLPLLRTFNRIVASDSKQQTTDN